MPSFNKIACRKCHEVKREDGVSRSCAMDCSFDNIFGAVRQGCPCGYTDHKWEDVDFMKGWGGGKPSSYAVNDSKAEGANIGSASRTPADRPNEAHPGTGERELPCYTFVLSDEDNNYVGFRRLQAYTRNKFMECLLAAVKLVPEVLISNYGCLHEVTLDKPLLRKLAFDACYGRELHKEIPQEITQWAQTVLMAAYPACPVVQVRFDPWQAEG